MPCNPAIHHRRSHRLQGYDYTSPGWYFLTICTHQRECLFGEIRDGQMVLNDVGMEAQVCWQRLPQHFAYIALDAFVVMPNHVHGIIQIVEFPNTSDRNDADRTPPTSGRGEAFWLSRLGKPICCSQNVSPLRSVKPQTDRPNGPSPGSIGAIAGNYKSVSTRYINRLRHALSTPVWQRNYHDRIIRNQQGLDDVRAYIHNNPRNWERDRVYRHP